MKRLIPALLLAGIALLPSTTFAASNPEIEQFTHETLSTLILLASLAAAFFLIKGGYLYITSTGKPAALEEAKHTIKNALIGLVVVIGASVFSSLLNSAFSEPATGSLGQNISLVPIEPVAPDSSLAQVLIDAIAGFLKSIVQSATKPVLDAIMAMLTSTPSLVNNSVIFNFWLTIVGIADSLFALVIALLGFQIMSATSLGFEEQTLKQMLPRVGLGFLFANTSIFLIDWVVQLNQALITAILNSSEGLSGAWLTNAFDPAVLFAGAMPLVTLIFLVVFVLLSVVLLLFYITRLMILAVGAVLAPLLGLLWVLPKFKGMAESSMKAYLVTVFSLFVHVVIIQLASAFLTLPDQVGTNPLVSVMVGIAMFALLLKTTTVGMQLVLASEATSAVTRIGGQIMNVMSAPTAAKAATSSPERIAALKGGR